MAAPASATAVDYRDLPIAMPELLRIGGLARHNDADERETWRRRTRRAGYAARSTYTPRTRRRSSANWPDRQTGKLGGRPVDANTGEAAPATLTDTRGGAMRYWDEMQDKFGFRDGEAVPAGAEAYREVYLLAVNRLAEQLGSRVRAVPYDPAGMHNWCLVLFRDAGDQGVEGTRQDLVAIAADEAEQDEAMIAAIEQARTLPLDDYVDVTVRISPAFDAYLAGLAAEPGDERSGHNR